MKTYHFDAVVEADGSVRLSGLPPQQKVEIVVLESTDTINWTDFPQELQDWLQDLRTRHPFTKMSKEEILKALRKTREEVWAEQHES